MGTWVTCPECFQDLPRKYKSKKERKELHDAACSGCKNKDARKAYEIGVKRGIWLKKWKRAVNSFNKAATEFEKIGDSKSKFTIELMGLLSRLNSDKNEKNTFEVIHNFISEKYTSFLNQNFYIPEFQLYDPLYYEAKAWREFLEISKIESVSDKVNQMKKTAQEFFNIEYGPLYFSTYITNTRFTNVEVALNLEAESEQILGSYFASQGDVENASNHLSNAIIAYLNLEQMTKARQIKKIRQSLRMETACWICGARSKGHRQTFNFKYTGLSEQHYDRVLGLLKQRQERNPTFYDDTVYTTGRPIATIQEEDVKEKKNQAGIYLSTCTICQGLIDELAWDVVEEALIPVWKAIHSLEAQINEIIAAINSIQASLKELYSLAHRH
ncbi:MAG: hypothetical protein ACFFDN_17440 [Candidatus Hodarchaeota archaeon]